MADGPLRVLVGGLVVAGSLVAGLAVVADREGASSETSRECGLEQVERPPYPSKPPKRLTLKPESAAGISIPFGRTRSMASEIFYLTPQDGAVKDRSIPLKLKKRPLRRQEVYGAILPGEYDAVALVTGASEVALRICVPASVAQDVDPGTYTGGIVIADRRVEKTTVAVTVTLQYRSYPWIVILFGLIVLVSGAGSVWAAGRRAKEGDVFANDWRKDLWSWTKRNLIAIALGVIAATSAFIASYWRNASWGARAPEDWFTLLGAMFAAFTAAVTAGSRAGGSDVDEAAAARRTRSKT